MPNFFDALEEMVIEGALDAPKNCRRGAEAVRDATQVFLRQMNNEGALDSVEGPERVNAVLKATAWLVALCMLMSGGKECNSVTQEKMLLSLVTDAKSILPVLQRGTAKWHQKHAGR